MAKKHLNSLPQSHISWHWDKKNAFFEQKGIATPNPQKISIENQIITNLKLFIKRKTKKHDNA